MAVLGSASRPRRAGRGHRALLLSALGLLALAADGCFFRSFVYKPVPVDNAIGDSTTVLAGTTLHAYRTDRYELYGPTEESIAASAQQVNRAYREFRKHFGESGPRLAIVVADSSFAITPVEAGTFARKRLHTFVYVRPRNLRDVDGIPPDTRLEEIWPISARVGREMVAAYADERRRRPPEVEIADHALDHHVEPMPVWFVDAAVALLSDPGAPDRVMRYLRPRLAEAPSAATLIDMSPDRAVEHISTNMEQRTIVGAAGVALVLYAIDQEGPRIVGRLAENFVEGRTAREVLKNAQHLPHTDADLDRAWRTWVREQYRR